MSSKGATFSLGFIAFWKFTQNFESFEKKIVFIASICRTLLPPKNVSSWMPSNSCLKTPFANQRVKGSKTLLKSARQHFYANLPLISNKLSFVWCLIVWSQDLGLLFNSLTADHMYSSQSWQKLLQEVQLQLSSKPLTFSSNFIAFSKST